jgi:hypothetical protein
LNITNTFRPMARARVYLLLLSSAALVACGPVHLVARSDIPQPLIAKMPAGVALYVPTEFSQYVHKEERSGTKWQIEIGKAQTETVTRLVNAMFEQVVSVDSVNAGATHANEIKAILEPSVEEFAFVTPRDAGSPYFAVSIKYRLNVYSPDGKLADSWGFTGYGTAQSQGVIMDDPLIQATSLAMRDAGAKLAVEFREQPMVRDLMPNAQSPNTAAGLPNAGSQVAKPSAETTPAKENEPAENSSAQGAASGPSDTPPSEATTPSEQAAPSKDSQRGATTSPSDGSSTSQPVPPNQ